MKTFKRIVDRAEAGETEAIERELTDADGSMIAWHTLDVDAYLATTPAHTTPIIAAAA